MGLPGKRNKFVRGEEKRMRTLEEVENEIAQVQKELQDVHGSETEVYARIVGYYRAVRNWNKGKKDEFKSRKLFKVEEEGVLEERTFEESAVETQRDVRIEEIKIDDDKEKVLAETLSAGNENTSITYELFTRPGCPHCPPVKKYMAECALSGSEINVDTEAGLNNAAVKGVFSTPTVVLYNSDGQEIVRAHSVDELEEVFSGIKEKSIA